MIVIHGSLEKSVDMLVQRLCNNFLNKGDFFSELPIDNLKSFEKFENMGPVIAFNTDKIHHYYWLRPRENELH